MKFLWSLLATCAFGAVIEVTDDNIDDYLDNGIPMILDMYASWCGHCKTFAPLFDELAASYEDQSDKIQFIKIDADENKGTGKKFDIKYFPTVKFVDGEENEEIKDRTLVGLKGILREKLGLEPDSADKINARADAKAEADLKKRADLKEGNGETNVIYTDVDGVDEAVDGKFALVGLISDECGSECATMIDTWEKIAHAFRRDDQVAITLVDIPAGDDSYKEKFNENNIPATFLYTPYHEGAISFMGGGKLKDLMSVFKNIGAIDRDEEGNLTKKSGLIPHLDMSVLPDFEELAEKIEPRDHVAKDIYLEIIEKAEEDKSYLKAEFKRLKKIIKNEETSIEDYEPAKIRWNIINSFVAALVAKKEL